MKEIVIACCRVAQKNPTLLVDEQTKDFWRWRDTILLNEDVLLETICFDLTVESPHKILYDMLKQLGAAHAKPLRSAAWSFLNDSTTTQLCLLFSSRVIAAAALYCAAKHCDYAFADDKVGRPWWEVMNVPLRDIKRACNYMADVYQERRSGNTEGSSGTSGSGGGDGNDSGTKEGNSGGGEASGRSSIYVGLHTPEEADGRSTKTRQHRQQSSSPTASSAKRARSEEADENGTVRGRDTNVNDDRIRTDGINDEDDEDDKELGRERASSKDRGASDDEPYRKRQRTASTGGGGGGGEARGAVKDESGHAGDGRREKPPNEKEQMAEEVGSEDGEVEG